MILRRRQENHIYTNISFPTIYSVICKSHTFEPVSEINEQAMCYDDFIVKLAWIKFWMFQVPYRTWNYELLDKPCFQMRNQLLRFDRTDTECIMQPIPMVTKCKQSHEPWSLNPTFRATRTMVLWNPYCGREPWSAKPRISGDPDHGLLNPVFRATRIMICWTPYFEWSGLGPWSPESAESHIPS